VTSEEADVMNVLLWAVGLISTGIAIWQFTEYAGQKSENMGFWPHMWLALVFAGVACVCAFIFFFKKFRADSDQDISITKF
jgi:hypothetical protein